MGSCRWLVVCCRTMEGSVGCNWSVGGVIWMWYIVLRAAPAMKHAIHLVDRTTAVIVPRNTARRGLRGRVLLLPQGLAVRRSCLIGGVVRAWKREHLRVGVM